MSTYRSKFEATIHAFSGHAGGLAWTSALSVWARSLDAEADDIENETIRLDIRTREIITARAKVVERKNALEAEQRNFEVAVKAATAASVQVAAQSTNRSSAVTTQPKEHHHDN